MSNTFPTTLNNFTTGATSEPLGTVGHAEAHNALETKVGVDNSAVTTSLDYKVAHRLPLEGGTMTGNLVIQPTSDSVGTILVKNAAGEQVFEVDVLNKWVKVGTDQPNYDMDPNVSFYVSRSTDGYHAINIVNPNNGTLASTDIVAVNDTTSPGDSGYVDLGINSSTYADANYGVYGAGEGYVYCIDNNFYVGASGAGSSLFFFTGGHANKTYIRAELSETNFNLDTTISGDVLASAAEITTGTEPNKIVTPKELKDAGIVVTPVKASGAEITTGTDDAKFATAKALADAGVNTRLASKIISISRNMTSATGSVGYTGVGFTPTSLVFIGWIEATHSISINVVDSARGIGSIFSHVAANMGGASGTMYMQVDGSNYQGATVTSFDADGFTLSWTKTGSPTGTAVWYVLCFK